MRPAPARPLPTPALPCSAPSYLPLLSLPYCCYSTPTDQLCQRVPLAPPCYAHTRAHSHIPIHVIPCRRLPAGASHFPRRQPSAPLVLSSLLPLSLHHSYLLWLHTSLFPRATYLLCTTSSVASLPLALLAAPFPQWQPTKLSISPSSSSTVEGQRGRDMPPGNTKCNASDGNNAPNQWV